MPSPRSNKDKLEPGWFRRLGSCARPSAATATLSTLLVGACAIGAAQNMIAPSLTAVAHSLGVADHDRDLVLGGWMSIAFFLVGAPLSVFIGAMADRSPRIPLFRWLILIAGMVAAFNGLTWSVYQLLLLRVVHGAVHGALQPVLFSVVGDLCPPAQRAALSSYVGLAIGGGTAVGQLLAGLVSSAFGWRLPYFCVAAACVAANSAVGLFAEEPLRGKADAVVASADGASLGGRGDGSLRSPPGSTLQQPMQLLPGSAEGRGAVPAPDPIAPVVSSSSSGGGMRGGPSALVHRAWQHCAQVASQLRGVLAVPSNALVFGQGLAGTVPWSVVTVFLTDYLVVEARMSTAGATLIVALFGLGAVVGGLAGGRLGTAVYTRWGPRAVPLAVGVAQASSAVPVLWLIRNAKRVTAAATAAAAAAGADQLGGSPGTSAAAALAPMYVVAVCAGLVASLTGPNLKAMLLNANPPATRARVFGWAYVVDSVAKGLAPAMIGGILAASARGGAAAGGGKSAGAPWDREALFSLAMGGWVVSGCVIVCVSWTIQADEERARGETAKRRDGGGMPMGLIPGGGAAEAASPSAPGQAPSSQQQQQQLLSRRGGGGGTRGSSDDSAQTDHGADAAGSVQAATSSSSGGGMNGGGSVAAGAAIPPKRRRGSSAARSPRLQQHPAAAGAAAAGAAPSSQHSLGVVTTAAAPGKARNRVRV